jgi:hypothetical protein
MLFTAVDIQRLVPHPLNPNRMSAAYLAKLKANIRDTGQYPAIIVRNLSKSAKYGPGTPYFERAGGENALQILDGHQRWRILLDLGYEKATVNDWGALDDTQALKLLATLNRLRGKDDSAKRATILSLLRELVQDDQRVVEYLPETVGDLTRKIERVEAQPDIDEASADFEPFTIMVDNKLGRIINAAIALRRSKPDLPGLDLDPKEFMTIRSAYEKARALAAICGDYILRESK